MCSHVFECRAKINLGLSVGLLREDKKHNVNTLMASVSLNDRITFHKNERTQIECDSTNVPTDENNIIFKTVEQIRLCRHFDGGLYAQIEKRIPSLAGLGGGSADAAATIIAVNDIYNLKLSLDDQINIAKKIGADVPFSLLGGTVLCNAAGDTPVNKYDLPLYHVIIIKPQGGISTKEAYAAIDKYNSHCANKFDSAVAALKEYRYDDVKKYLCNDFENYVFSVLPKCEKIKADLYDSGAFFALLSGSGSSLFGLFADEKIMHHAKNILSKKYKDVFESHLCDVSIVKL